MYVVNLNDNETETEKSTEHPPMYCNHIDIPWGDYCRANMAEINRLFSFAFKYDIRTNLLVKKKILLDRIKEYIEGNQNCLHTKIWRQNRENEPYQESKLIHAQFFTI